MIFMEKYKQEMPLVYSCTPSRILIAQGGLPTVLAQAVPVAIPVVAIPVVHIATPEAQEVFTATATSTVQLPTPCTAIGAKAMTLWGGP